MAKPLYLSYYRSEVSQTSADAQRLVLGLVSHVQPSSQFFGLTIPAPVLSLQHSREEVFSICAPSPAQVLSNTGTQNNAPLISHAVIEDTLCRVHCQYTNDWGFGVAHLLTQPAGFEAAVSHLYSQILAIGVQTQLPYFVKTWNYIEGINADENGTERYRLFNSGRRQAFLAASYPIGGGVSAACALGAESGGLSVAFLLSKHKALNLENPRQQSAYLYPQEYGHARPLFARASLITQSQGPNLLFLSGTASIVGHTSMHPNNVELQTEEMLRNIHSLLTQANAATMNSPWTLDQFIARVYIRHGADVEKVRAILFKRGLTHACFLKADICRKELLVEMEATACA